MLAGVSHDLRTPLTRMKLQLEMAGTDDTEDLKRDIVEMEHMLKVLSPVARAMNCPNQQISRVCLATS